VLTHPAQRSTSGRDIMALLPASRLGSPRVILETFNPFATGANPNVYAYALNNRLFTVHGLK
jgi:hypothetical protein